MSDDDKMANAVLRLWDIGMDTEQIAKVLQEKQHEIERVLHVALDLRRRQKRDNP